MRAVLTSPVASEPIVTEPVTLSVAGTAPRFVTAPENVTVIGGLAASFSVVAVGDPALSYQWATTASRRHVG